MSYSSRQNRYGGRRKRWLILGIILVPIVCGVVASVSAWQWYQDSLKPLNEAETSTVLINVEVGTTEDQISTQLEQKNLIRSAAAYRLYVRLNRVGGVMKAGGYELSPSLSVAEIVDVFRRGEVAVDLVTIVPASRLDQIQKTFREAGYSESEIIAALNPKAYPDHPALVNLPDGATLEGYLYPDSFQRSADTTLETIVALSLDEFAKAATPELVRQLKDAHGLSLHQAVILASIVEREVGNDNDRSKVAQVFLKRFKMGMSLGSDPTALYGALLFNIEPSVFADTPYNTRFYAGLPPGPINSVSESSLKAVAYPADTDYLYFVSGDDGVTYFSRTLEEHEALTAQHCIELCRSY